MQYGGKPERVKLNVDLTKYDTRCIAGEMGYTIPNGKIGMFGGFDTFVAVRFDNGAVMDIVVKSLEYIKTPVKKAKTLR